MSSPAAPRPPGRGLRKVNTSSKSRITPHLASAAPAPAPGAFRAREASPKACCARARSSP